MKQTYLIFMSQAEIYICLVLTPSQFLTYEIPFLTSASSKLPKYQSQSRRTLQKNCKIIAKTQKRSLFNWTISCFGVSFL